MTQRRSHSHCLFPTKQGSLSLYLSPPTSGSSINLGELPNLPNAAPPSQTSIQLSVLQFSKAYPPEFRILETLP
ncbi:unnamed protein product [Lactuca virosa]|uniref:Uncharacterized protein n=1 Tax=Lactuca virosa TaxID=75947 RepID=A0AAU9M0M6_9ASTR|nr:unnamed protein product [Lactuca virosa]